jgi:hypothetical protein
MDLASVSHGTDLPDWLAPATFVDTSRVIGSISLAAKSNTKGEVRTLQRSLRSYADKRNIVWTCPPRAVLGSWASSTKGLSGSRDGGPIWSSQRVEGGRAGQLGVWFVS